MKYLRAPGEPSDYEYLCGDTYTPKVYCHILLQYFGFLKSSKSKQVLYCARRHFNTGACICARTLSEWWEPSMIVGDCDEWSNKFCFTTSDSPLSYNWLPCLLAVLQIHKSMGRGSCVVVCFCVNVFFCVWP